MRENEGEMEDRQTTGCFLVFKSRVTPGRKITVSGRISPHEKVKLV